MVCTDGLEPVAFGSTEWNTLNHLASEAKEELYLWLVCAWSLHRILWVRLGGNSALK